MRILVLVPVTTNLWNRGVFETCRRAADATTEIEVENVDDGVPSIECMVDEAFATLPTLRAAAAAERRGFDAVIIYCFGNPGLEAVRERVLIPVLGLGEAGHLFACLLGDRYGILSTLPGAVPRHRRKAAVLETAGRLAGIRALELDVLSFVNRRRVLARAVQVGRRLVEEDGADVVVLGCGSLLGMADELSARLGVPVVDPSIAAVKLTEACVLMRTSHSRQAYASPPPKLRTQEPWREEAT